MISTTLREDNHVEYIGLSTDQKPITNVRNGSTFIEMDTSSIYLFDESSKT